MTGKAEAKRPKASIFSAMWVNKCVYVYIRAQFTENMGKLVEKFPSKQSNWDNKMMAVHSKSSSHLFKFNLCAQ